MDKVTLETSPRSAGRAWLQELARFQEPNLARGLGQLIPTLAAYFALLAAMIWLVRARYPYALVLLLAAPAAGLLVRIFIFFHDACHRSFFRASWANVALGYLCGILTFTPYHEWRAAHIRHHATAGDLDRRGMGDVWTMTLDEYQAAPWHVRLAYRVFRHPLAMFGMGPGVVFLLVQRFPPRRASRVTEHLSVHATTLAIAGIVVLAASTIGLRAYIAVQLPVILLAGMAGIWLFYVQHQFKGVYWARHNYWDSTRAALEGSSYYQLPRVLQWFSGSIGFHHVHHLRPRIPNYNLEKCYQALAELQQVPPLTLRASLGCARLALVDEQASELVSFAALRTAGGATRTDDQHSRQAGAGPRGGP